jgi:LPXTG-site transpeptidase (sortase) family protein
MTDQLPAGYSWVSDDGVGTYVPGTGVWTIGNLSTGQSVTLNITATVLVTGPYNNTAELTGYLDNDPDSDPNNNVPGEDDQATVTVTPRQDNPSTLSKTVLSTSETSTSGSNTAIGEIVTYELSVSVPPGVFPNARLVDTMARGLAFDGCTSISAGTLTTSIVDPAPFNYICTHPAVDSNGSLDPQDIDRRVTFNFGTLTNNSSAPVTLTVQYRAVVLDIPSNVSGVTLANNVSFECDVCSLTPATASVSVVEPHLSIEKTADIGFVAVGSEVTFTVDITHVSPPGSPASNADAFDVLIEDILPAEFEYVAGTLDCTSGAQDANSILFPSSCSYDPATRTIQARWDRFTLNGGNGQIRFRVRTLSIPANGNITNTARVEWTSLPGSVGPQSYTPNIYSTERYYDPTNPAGVNGYGTTSSLTLTPLGSFVPGDGDGESLTQTRRFNLPLTGFAPGRVTELTGSPITYTAAGNNKLEIASLGLKLPIMGVPLQKGEWNVQWLMGQAGWLEGTAFPGLEGNSVITGHVITQYGVNGPFARLHLLQVGEYIVVTANGNRYTYKVVSNRLVEPNDITILRHEENAWISLITCDDYDEKTNSYLKRVVVRAVLVDVSPTK